MPQDTSAATGNLHVPRPSQQRARKSSREARTRQSSQGQLQGCLSKPLSELARENPSIVVSDVAAFSMRSTELRLSEAATAGKVKRPLNAFMLYRKAYQNVAKTQCKRDNHQQVSSVCGESWKLREPSSVIDHFNHLASVEKQLHERAFPEYRYDPVPAKRLREASDVDPAGTSDNSDADVAVRSGRGGRGRSARPPSRLRRSHTGGDQVQATTASREPYHIDPWQTAQSTLFPEQGAAGASFTYADLENHLPRGAAQAGNQLFDMMLPFPGNFPGQTLPLGSYGPIDDCLDPLLRRCAVDPQFAQKPVSGAGTSSVGWGVGSYDVIPDLDANGAHNAYLRGNEGDWAVEQLGEGSHFEDWMGQGDGSGRQQ